LTHCQTHASACLRSPAVYLLPTKQDKKSCKSYLHGITTPRALWKVRLCIKNVKARSKSFCTYPCPKHFFLTNPNNILQQQIIQVEPSQLKDYSPTTNSYLPILSTQQQDQLRQSTPHPPVTQFNHPPPSLHSTTKTTS
jgi:hypothetical protein